MFSPLYVFGSCLGARHLSASARHQTHPIGEHINPLKGPGAGTSSDPSHHRRRQPPLHFACNSSASHSRPPQKPRNTNALDSDPEIPTRELHAKLRVCHRQASQQPQTVRSTPAAREHELPATSATTTKRASDTTGTTDGWAAPRPSWGRPPTSALLVPPTRYVRSDSRKAQASLGATSSSASPRWISPLATGVTAPSFFLFVTTTGVMVS